MDFALTEEQDAIFDMARSFGADHIAPYALAWEKDGTIPRELWTEIAALGFGGLYVSEVSGALTQRPSRQRRIEPTKAIP